MSEKDTSPQAVRRLIFENLRNMFSCIALAVGGIYVMAFSEYSPLGDWAVSVGVVVVVISAALLIWNAVAGAKELAKDLSLRSLRFWLVFGPAFALYVVLSLTVYGSVIKAQTQQFREAAATAAQKAASGVAVPKFVK